MKVTSYRKLLASLLPLFIACGVVFAAEGEATPSGLANSEPNYVALRQLALDESFDVSGLTVRRDVGVLQLNGKIAFGKEMLGKRVLGVFTGAGKFVFEPALPWEQRSLSMYVDASSVTEDFSSAVFWFTDDAYREITSAGTLGSVDPRASEELQRLRSRLRKSEERPRSGLESMLTAEDIDNVEALVLADLMNPAREGAFLAYMRGQRYQDLRYFVRPSGALPQMLSSEEVALVNFDPGSDREGIWYLAHRADEYSNGRASDHRAGFPDAQHYEVETTIAKNRKIEGRTRIRFQVVESGARVIALSLLPELRVGSVKLEGAETAFIQEAAREDGSLFVVAPEPIAAGEVRTLEVTYSGEDVVSSEGGGNFAVDARTSWYPNFGSFVDRATFDLTFHYPKDYELVSVGRLVDDPQKGKDMTTAHWRSDVPLAVAGFNYGEYKKRSVRDDATSYDIEGYATSQVPDSLRALNTDLTSVMSPRSMMDQAVAEARASVQIFSQFFGPLPYGRVAITQQPQFNFGQSWPTLVYLPVSAFLDSTQRWTLLGTNTFSFGDFIQEITPHEVAHQWWGHIVGWESYHDQWLSEGLADFSAGLYLQATRSAPTDYHNFLRRSRDAALDKNQHGFSPNDVGPIWMGSRLSTPRSAGAYQLVYAKGGYVIHMLRAIMYDLQRGDAPFVEMMKDFVASHGNGNASTESFQAVVEKHMSPVMDAGGDGTMQWFFDQWVYGSEIPSYEFAYKLTPQGEGRSVLDVRITQTGVSDGFVMPVPLYAEANGRLLRLGSVVLKGSSTSDPIQVTLPLSPSRVMIGANLDILAGSVKEVPF